MSLKNTSHIIQIDKELTYVYLSYYNTVMKPKKIDISSLCESELWSIQKNPHVIDCHNWSI